MDLNQVIALDKAYYMNTFGDRLPLMFTGGEGNTLFGSDGKRYTDFFAGVATNALGYSNEPLIKAISTQAAKLIHCSNHFHIESQALLAKELCENSCAHRVFFGNSGAEAIEGAIKLARKYFSKNGEDRSEIVSMNNSFHGRTLAALAATGQEKYSAGYAPLPGGFTRVPYADISATKAAVTAKTAAVLVEPIQGEGGVIDGGAEYLQALRALCDETGALLILDEIQTGMGRTGKLFAHELYGVKPDVFTLAKALGGGVPIGALLCTEKFAAFSPGEHGTTFGGNPLATAAGLAVIKQLTAPGFLDDVAAKGNELKSSLINMQKQFASLIIEVRGQGLMLGMQLASALSATDVQRAAIEKGFICGTAGGNTLRLLPPLTITRAEIAALLTALEQIFKNESGVA